MEIAALATYRPAWVDAKERRQVGPDEDAATLGVSAGRLLAGRLDEVRQIVLVTRRPDALLGTAGEVITEGLGMAADVPLAEQIGGAPATINALLSAAPGTLVLAVDPLAPAGAAAALVGPGQLSLGLAGAVRYSVPIHTVPLPGAVDLTYDDPRLLRERGWKRTVRELTADLRGGTDESTAVAVAGVARPDKLVPGAIGVEENEAAAPLFLLSRLARDFRGEDRDQRLVAVENGHAVAVDVGVTGGIPVTRQERPAHRAPESWSPMVPADLPASPAAYERAFEAKVGLKAGVCECGTVHYPPRVQCTGCGELDRQHLRPLPTDASIYSVVTVRTKVPGMTAPYSLAVVDIDGTPVRVLTQVTDAPPGTTAIGAVGRLVLRRVAVRAGVPDYAYAFQPKEQQA